MPCQIQLFKQSGSTLTLVPEFDSGRHTGDGLFAADTDFEYLYADRGNPEAPVWCRPVDFNRSKLFVSAAIYPGNQPRLLSALERLEQEKDLWFLFTW